MDSFQNPCFKQQVFPLSWEMLPNQKLSRWYLFSYVGVCHFVPQSYFLGSVVALPVLGEGATLLTLCFLVVRKIARFYIRNTLLLILGEGGGEGVGRFSSYTMEFCLNLADSRRILTDNDLFLLNINYFVLILFEIIVPIRQYKM